MREIATASNSHTYKRSTWLGEIKCEAISGWMRMPEVQLVGSVWFAVTDTYSTAKDTWRYNILLVFSGALLAGRWFKHPTAVAVAEFAYPSGQYTDYRLPLTSYCIPQCHWLYCFLAGTALNFGFCHHTYFIVTTSIITLFYVTP